MHVQCLYSDRNAICVMYRYISLGHKIRLIWESCITCICNVFKRQNNVTPSNNEAVCSGFILFISMKKSSLKCS